MSELRALAAAIDRKILKNELTPERFLRHTNNGGNTIYVIDALSCPNTMQEIGRLRELTFREAGGGTGEPVDIDAEDTAPNGYRQLVVWDPVQEEILGGYRYIVSHETHPQHLSTEHYFRFSDKFRREYLPYTLELGRSFVAPAYQRSGRNAKGLYALDNLWDGLAAIMAPDPDIRYLFGKVTMYGHYDPEARDRLIYFLHKYFPDPNHLVEPLHPIDRTIDERKMAAIFNGENYAEDYKILSREIRSLGETIPPLINSYMNLSPTMRVFATVNNPDFGDVEETGILIARSDLYTKKVERHFAGLDPLPQFEIV